MLADLAESLLELCFHNMMALCLLLRTRSHVREKPAASV